MVRLLDLFSGTGSFAKVSKCFGWEVISLDIDRRPHITHCEDILSFNYKQYPVGYFDIITASPPCTKYSMASRIPIKDRDLTNSNAMVEKTLEIIKYFDPKYWFIENPQSGYLKTQSFMDNLPFTDVDYCRYGYPVRKRTRIWNNAKVELNMCDKQCYAFDPENNFHRFHLGSTRGKN